MKAFIAGMVLLVGTPFSILATVHVPQEQPKSQASQTAITPQKVKVSIGETLAHYPSRHWVYNGIFNNAIHVTVQQTGMFDSSSKNYELPILFSKKIKLPDGGEYVTLEDAGNGDIYVTIVRD